VNSNPATISDAIRACRCPPTSNRLPPENPSRQIIEKERPDALLPDNGRPDRLKYFAFASEEDGVLKNSTYEMNRAKREALNGKRIANFSARRWTGCNRNLPSTIVHIAPGCGEPAKRTCSRGSAGAGRLDYWPASRHSDLPLPWAAPAVAWPITCDDYESNCPRHAASPMGQILKSDESLLGWKESK